MIIDLEAKTLTPIWTGNIDKNSNVLKITSIIGSMRWWFEALVRGMGGYACDPTDREQNICNFTENGFDGVCPACKIFGTTGWARMFRIETSGLQAIPLFFVSSKKVYKAAGNWLTRIYRGSQIKNYRFEDGVKFRFDAQTLWSERFNLKLIPIREHTKRRQVQQQLIREDVSNILLFLLNTIVAWGAIGAKTQNGFGQIEILTKLDMRRIEAGKKKLKELIGNQSATEMNGKFTLDKFFGRIYKIGDPAPYSLDGKLIGDKPSEIRDEFIPCSFDIRYKSSAKIKGRGFDFGMRPFLLEKLNRRRCLVNKLLGETKAREDKDRLASRIHVSHLYKDSNDDCYKLKIWGCVPSSLESEEIDVHKIASYIDEFICDSKGMFPGSEIIKKFSKMEVL
ncbi:MAG: type III-B CRISPR module RAMP protein Cmr1 [Promethearchaeota archaeon]